MSLPEPKGAVGVENVSYILPGVSRPTLLDIDLEAQPGEALAIIGPSGAGKSTLARLIVGLARPHRGAVRMDGADIFSQDRNMIGPYIGFLPQEVELFPGTIHENIARMQDDADHAKVLEAARISGVHELILRLPQGYDTQIIAGGSNLSGGQRQRIGLARAVFGKPKLLVLDEPDSNLDTQGDRALNEAILTMKGLGTTIILVAHRPSLMRHVDRIAVLDEGRLHLSGPKNEVLAQLQRPDPTFAKAS
jgi:ABC-type protease/lipase transport system fused ATPase/permease subunit